MIKKLSSLFVGVFFSLFLFASPVTVNVAKNLALNWYMHNAPANTKDFTVNESILAEYNGLTTYYTFTFKAGGFVMVAADDISYPILGYSYESNFDKNNLPINAKAFFEDYSRQIWDIVYAKLDNKTTKIEWTKILTNNFTKDAQAVAPICVTTWDQGSPYNLQCPSGDPTGCVATAMAQIMKKWNYPTTGNGSSSYTPSTNPSYGVQTANYGATTYAWASMTNSYSASSTSAAKNAVATLMYHCGVSVQMDYDAAGSGAYTSSVPTSLIDHFRYQPTGEVKSQSLFPTEALWNAMIKAEMDAGRPVLLAGDDGATAGHAFVCDGYNTLASPKYHINWGWSGSSNGYYFLNALNPSGYNFSSNRQAVIRIQPLSALMPMADYTVSNVIPAIAELVNFTSTSTNNPTTYAWTFDGGTPATSTLQNPTGIIFATNGYHVVTLTVTNANGADTKTRERYVKVGGVPTKWIKQNSGFTSASRGIDQIFILDANTVWARAYDGKNSSTYIREFTRTNDGGTTWTPGSITFTNSTNYGFSNIFPLSYTTAYACMFPISGTGGKIIKTIDGGTTWTEQTTAPFTNSWADFVHFFDANNGVCMGDPIATTASDFVIYTTSNGGTTWTQVSTASLPNSLASEAGIVNLYDAVGNTIWFTTNKGRVYKSIDKGLTWTVNTTGFTNTFTMKFKDANTGIAVLDTLPYTIKKTINGGSTWTTITPTGFLVKYPRLAYIPGTASTWINVAAYPGSGSSYSTDDCASFLNIDTGSVQFTSVAFLNSNVGWAGSFNTSSTDGGIYKFDPALLPGAGYTVSGTLNYNNTALTPIASATVNLMNGATQVGTTTTNASGNFSFTTIANGTYTITGSTATAWGGVTATDALKLKRHIASLELLTEPIRLIGADVNASGSINSTDVLKVQRRIASLDLAFTRPDWIFEKPTVGGNSLTVSGANVSQNFYALCAGDVNGSYTPAFIMKSNPISLDNSSILKVSANETFELPIRVTNSTELGAVQLIISYPSELVEIVGVTTNSSNDELIYNADKGKLNIVWSSLHTMVLNSNDAIVTLIVKAKNASGSVTFDVLNGSELADATGNVISYSGLSTSSIELTSINSVSANKLNLNNYPNPFTKQTQIEYEISEGGKVSLTVYDILGKEVASLVNAEQTIGKYSVVFDCNSLHSGIYNYKLDVVNKTQHYQLIKQMSLVK